MTTTLTLNKKENKKKVGEIIALVNQIEQLSQRISKGKNTGNILSENIIYLCRDIRWRLDRNMNSFPTF